MTITILDIVNEELPEELDDDQPQNEDSYLRFPIGKGEFFKEGLRNPLPAVTSDDA